MEKKTTSSEAYRLKEGEGEKLSISSLVEG